MQNKNSDGQPAGMQASGLLYLVIVYIVWGSTYLAIRVAVRDGAGFTPFMLGMMRAFLAGFLLLAWGALRRERLHLQRRELLTLFASALLLWVGGNGLVMLGEIRADSGVAALIIASTPMWTALIEAVLDRRWPSWLLIGSLLVGLLGIVVLSMPMILGGLKADAFSIVLLLIAALSWAAGTVLQKRNPVLLSPAVISGYQMLFGGIGFAVVVLLLREPLPHPIPSAWFAWGYLVLFGSIIAFTSYIKALSLLPTSIVMTYGYVNPVIAVILGWIILNERITPWTIGGTVLILVAISGVFRSRKQAAPQVMPAAQADAEG